MARVSIKVVTLLLLATVFVAGIATTIVLTTKEDGEDVQGTTGDAQALNGGGNGGGQGCCSKFNSIPYLEFGDIYDVDELLGGCNGAAGVESCAKCKKMPTHASCNACCEMRAALGASSSGCMAACEKEYSCSFPDSPSPASGPLTCSGGACGGGKKCTASPDGTYCRCSAGGK